MSRLWSRFGARTAAVALLSVGVAGGFYLGEDRQTQQQGLTAQVGLQVDRAEYAYQRDRQADHRLDSAKQRAAEYQAKLRAAEAAKEAAQRAKEAEAAAASRKKAREAAAATKPYDGPIPSSCEEYSGNRKIGCAIMLDEGFGIDQFPCLDKLWTKESGWNHKAYNESSGAYGIPQALPGSKMGSVADDWKTNPATQIKWGLGYIEGRYDDPCGAWQHSQSSGWY
ncbi:MULTISPECIES: lytic transglycosylase domain-containing protein [Micromonospora]|uniref:Lytic transglycosylase domain-containing protein n=1 Tax=Micromonospora solifontis TaxID=2487138 RepID=A0ABX9WLG1_9ACTN|nr:MULTISPECIES: lytic transglycosylase domain-containing protein [Micromonospora]NES14332.1 lytic transglycosylase domain-containing protein [Micromonospora sp. PPF5-17B]NES35060.1 lytic transglycosylase domain-containing protein [Micromonospora solifontis]NES57759.1 lytic transglycosylase domain-containing protein [Micromonospora sp. PPF5-6]RNM01330.1 lytic transglycosylase domain-containing protein [Micromonospora solifontis]